MNLRADIRKTPGIYSDVISLVRPSDKLVLLKIPVVIFVSENVTERGIAIERKLAPFEIARTSLRLTQASALRFDGQIRELTAGRGSSVGVFIGNRRGASVYTGRFGVGRSMQKMEFQTPILPADEYEIVFYRSYGQPAVVNDVHVSGVLRTPFARVLGVDSAEAGKFAVAVEALDDVTLKQATATLLGTKMTARLDRGIAPLKGGFDAYLGTIDFGEERKSFEVELQQLAVDAAVESFLNMEVSFLDVDTGETLSRNWLDMKTEGTDVASVEFPRAVRRVSVVAYPNVVNWSVVLTRKINVFINLPFKTPVTAAWKTEAALELAPLQRTRLNFELPGYADGVYGKIELFDARETKLETLTF